MASQEDNPIFDEDLDDDENEMDNNSSSSLNGAAPFQEDPYPDPVSSSDTDDVITNDFISTTSPLPINSSVTLAIPSSVAPPSSLSAVTLASPSPKKPPAIIDDSRRLFQRLWTDEDEIELLQGFLDFTTSRGTTHHDTTAFYDQIKDKLQLDFNKNQLVEKLRRLKKKYRNVLSKISSGKEFLFKSPHDKATFELSSKIWTNLSGNYRGGTPSAGSGMVEFDDDDQNPNPNSNLNSVTIAAATPPRPPNSSYVISHINLNNAAAAAASASPVRESGSGSGGYEIMMGNSGIAGVGGGLAKLSTRKRPRTGKAEDKYIKTEGMMSNNNVAVNSPNNYVNNVNVSPPLQGMVEETVRNCLSPVLKDLINNAVNGAASGGVGGIGGGIGSAGVKGVGAIALNAVPLNFSAVKVGNTVEGMDEKWRKQQILELEVYSKRLELVQDQIKLSLEELRSMEQVD